MFDVRAQRARCPLVSGSIVVTMMNASPSSPNPPMSESNSAYLLFFRDASPDAYANLSPQQRQELMQRWNAWYDGLAAKGKVQHGQPLEPTGRVVSGPRGERVVDGPFAESKEAVGGYFLLIVNDIDEATEIARGCPSLEYGMTVEVRPIADACGALGVHGRPPAAASASVEAV